MLRAFERPLDDVRVLIVGQDPYPTPGHAVGLSFSVAPDVQPVPRSLANIFQELQTDLGLPPTVDRRPVPVGRPGRPAAQQGADRAARQTRQPPRQGLGNRDGTGDLGAGERGGPLVAILWGRDARNLVPHLGGIPAIESAHPSPLSAHSGFFGTRPFSRANELLAQQGAAPIDWRLP